VATRIVALVQARRPQLGPRANPCGNPERSA
jgi:hypothetical protein